MSPLKVVNIHSKRIRERVTFVKMAVSHISLLKKPTSFHGYSIQLTQHHLVGVFAATATSPAGSFLNSSRVFRADQKSNQKENNDENGRQIILCSIRHVPNEPKNIVAPLSIHHCTVPLKTTKTLKYNNLYYPITVTAGTGHL